MAANQRLLIADDDPDCRELLVLALAVPQVDITVALDGEQLVALVTDHGPFDVIITDLQMPGLEGTEALASLRRSGLTTPVLVITGATRADLAEAVAGLGNASLLRKPFTVGELRTALAEIREPERTP